MAKQLLFNVPVNDMQAAKQFFTAVGLELDTNLTDERATCFKITDNTVVALMSKEHFKEIIGDHAVADATKVNETLFAIGAESRAEVDTLVTNAVAAGGRELHEPMDLDQVYGRSFADLDGHMWNVFYQKA